MTISLLHRVATALPKKWEGELKRIHYRHRIRNGTFVSDEPEFAVLSRMIKDGDCVVDIGANVGFYTKRFAELVGSHGRVIAFEPIPETFVLLANNVEICGFSNVTLVNAAVSEGTGVAGMTVPSYSDGGQRNYYQAHLSHDGELRVMTVALDALQIPMPVKLIKIDVEGNEISALKGMQRLLARDHPLLIVEAGRPDVWDLLSTLGYVGKVLANSPNVIFTCNNENVVSFE